MFIYFQTVKSLNWINVAFHLALLHSYHCYSSPRSIVTELTLSSSSSVSNKLYFRHLEVLTLAVFLTPTQLDYHNLCPVTLLEFIGLCMAIMR